MHEALAKLARHSNGDDGVGKENEKTRTCEKMENEKRLRGAKRFGKRKETHAEKLENRKVHAMSICHGGTRKVGMGLLGKPCAEFVLGGFTEGYNNKASDLDSASQ